MEFWANDIIIVAMGPSGSGKSSFIKIATGSSEVEIGGGLKSCTQEVRPIVSGLISGDEQQRIMFVDTPGFDDSDSTISDIDVLDKISKWLQERLSNKFPLSGLLYFHRITDNRMGEGAKKALNIFKGLCGVQFAQGVVFTTTMWDEAESSPDYLATCESREKRLREDPEYWKTFLDSGSVTRRFRSSVESAKEVIKPILDYSTQARKLGQEYHLRLAKTRLQAEVGRGRQIAKTTAAHAIFPKDEKPKKGGLRFAPPESQNQPQHNDAVILLMGPTGAGKTSFIQAAVGASPESNRAGHGLQSSTLSIEMTRGPAVSKLGGNVVFVDTPGFDNTSKADSEILEMLGEWLHENLTLFAVPLAGILYFHRITDNRMNKTAVMNLKVFEKLCGIKEPLASRIVFTTTMWDEIKEAEGRRNESQLRSNYWKEMIRAGAQVFRFEHQSVASASAIVAYIVDLCAQKPDPLASPVATRMQAEMADGMDVTSTAAARALYVKAKEKVGEQEDKIKKLDKAIKSAKGGEKQLLSAQRAAAQGDLKLAESEVAVLKLSIVERGVFFLRKLL